MTHWDVLWFTAWVREASTAVLLTNFDFVSKFYYKILN